MSDCILNENIIYRSKIGYCLGLECEIYVQSHSKCFDSFLKRKSSARMMGQHWNERERLEDRCFQNNNRLVCIYTGCSESQVREFFLYIYFNSNFQNFEAFHALRPKPIGVLK